MGQFGTYRLCEQWRFRRACASAQSRQNIRYSLIQAVSQEESSDRKPDPWPLWMAGHAQLKFVMTECSKTQIHLTGLKWSKELNGSDSDLHDVFQEFYCVFNQIQIHAAEWQHSSEPRAVPQCYRWAGEGVALLDTEPNCDKVRGKDVQIMAGKATHVCKVSFLHNWAASWQNQQNDCALSVDSDQPGLPPSLIWVFAGRTCHFVGFVMKRLIYCYLSMLDRAAISPNINVQGVPQSQATAHPWHHGGREKDTKLHIQYKHTDAYRPPISCSR